jgi:DNA-binding LacI/PurR family transcriptional regulator
MVTGRRRPTSADVARLAGVSRATVSFVLNNTPSQSISATTREAVQRAAHELGYVPSAHATALRRGGSRLVLVLVPNWASGATIMRYLELTASHLAEHGLLTVTHVETAAPLRDLLTAIQPAAVVSLVPLSQEDSALLARAAIVEVHGYIADFPGKLESVTLNQQRMGQAQARYLVGLGLTRLVYVCGPETGHPLRPAGRIEGARGVVADVHDRRVRFEAVNYDTDEDLDGIAAAWAGSSDRVGVCAFDDDTALRILAALRRHGVDVPGKVAVVGMDDIPAGQFSEPPLTTVRPNLHYQSKAVAHATLTALGLTVEDGAVNAAADADSAAMIVVRGSA